MNWPNVSLGVAGLVTPIPDTLLGSRPTAQGVAAELGVGYTVTSAAETLGWVIRGYGGGGGGFHHLQAEAGISTGLFAALTDVVDLTVEGGAAYLYLTDNDQPERPFEEHFVTFPIGVTLGVRLSDLVNLRAGLQVKLPITVDGEFRPDAITTAASLAVDFDFGRKPLGSAIVAAAPTVGNTPQPPSAERIAAALGQATVQLERLREHVDTPEWLAKYVDQRIDKSPQQHPLLVEIDAVNACREWILFAGQGSPWEAAGRRPLHTLREEISSTLDIVFAYGTAEQKKQAGALFESLNALVPDTLKALAHRLTSLATEAIVRRLVAWGQELQAAIAKAQNGDVARLEREVDEYQRALLRYQECLGTIDPKMYAADGGAVQREEAIGVAGCLNQGGQGCGDRFERFLREPFDPSITADELTKQLVGRKAAKK